MKNTSAINDGEQTASEIILPQFIRQFKEAAEKAGFADLVTPLFSNAGRLNEKNTCISLFGTAEVNQLNSLLGEEIWPPSIHPPAASFKIGASALNEHSYYLMDGARAPLQPHELAAYACTAPVTPIELFLDNSWLRQHQLIIQISQYPAVTTDDAEELFSYFANTDVAVFLTDALAPLNKYEVFFIKAANHINIPLITGLSRLQMVAANERTGVLDYFLGYVNRHFMGADQIENDPESGNIAVDDLKNKIIKQSESFDQERQRTNFFIARLKNGLSVLRGLIIARQNENAGLINEIKQKGQKKMRQLGNKQDEWIGLEIVLVKKRQKIESQLREHLAKNREQVFKNLLFEINRSNDPKAAWERDLPFFINRELQITAERLSHIINSQLNDTFRWIAEEIRHLFKYNVVLNNSPAVQIEETSYQPHELSLLNPQRWRINTRFGAAATVLGVGFFFISAPVGGIVVASSIIYQAVVDQYIYTTNQKEKSLISGKLQNVVEVTEVAYINEFSIKLKTSFDQLIAGLKENQAAWLDEQKRALEGEINEELKHISGTDLAEALQETEQLIASMSKNFNS